MLSMVCLQCCKVTKIFKVPKIFDIHAVQKLRQPLDRYKNLSFNFFFFFFASTSNIDIEISSGSSYLIKSKIIVYKILITVL